MSVDANASSKLAMIYSRLAQLENHNEKRSKSSVWDDLCKRFTNDDLDPLEIANIEDIFKDALSSFDYGYSAATVDTESVVEKASTEIAQSTDGTGIPSIAVETYDSEAISRIRMLFMAEQQFAETLQVSLLQKVKRVGAFQSERDGYAAETFRLREDTRRLDARILDLEDLCRNLQRLSKEKDEQRAQLVELERSKSEHLEQECLQSIAAVTKKIEQEEIDLAAKDLENQSLKSKLEEFLQHMNLRKEKRQNEARAVDLQRRLEEARKAQADYLKEQEILRRESNKSRIRQLEETVTTLRRQLGSYADKFEEFEETLDRSTEVLEKIDERENTLASILEKLRTDNMSLKSKASEEDVAIIVAVEQKRILESDITSARGNYEKLEKKCRKLLTKRQELAKHAALAPPPPPTAAQLEAISASQPPSADANYVATAADVKETVPDTEKGPAFGKTDTAFTVANTSETTSSSSSSSAVAAAANARNRLKTPSPTLVGAPQAPPSGARRSGGIIGNNLKMSSSSYVLSSSSSPSRPGEVDLGLVGEGSPENSPQPSAGRKIPQPLGGSK